MDYAVLYGDLNLSESRAIMSYIVNTFGKESDYAPKNPVENALLNAALYWDMGSFYSAAMPE